MQRNYLGQWSTNDNSGGRNVSSPLTYSVVRADGTVLSRTVPPSSSDKTALKSRTL